MIIKIKQIKYLGPARGLVNNIPRILEHYAIILEDDTTTIVACEPAFKGLISKAFSILYAMDYKEIPPIIEEVIIPVELRKLFNKN